jgi:hypothetical protein
MTTLKPKDFIKSVLIDELGTMVNGHPYISFIIMGIGIEFLGKCLATTRNDWNESGHSGADFTNAIKTIPSLKKYESYLQTHKLCDSFRNGLAHAISPKHPITLSSKGELGHLVEQSGRLNLRVEDFYNDFRLACEHIINMSFASGDKMNVNFLQVPETTFNSGTGFSSGSTSQQGASGTSAHLEFES